MNALRVVLTLNVVPSSARSVAVQESSYAVTVLRVPLQALI
jgi:hypothetical protein